MVQSEVVTAKCSGFLVQGSLHYSPPVMFAIGVQESIHSFNNHFLSYHFLIQQSFHTYNVPRAVLSIKDIMVKTYSLRCP